MHLSLLHVEGSTDPLSIMRFDFSTFYPYFYLKDVVGFILFAYPFYTYTVMFNPNLLSHSDNFIEANPLVTPLHIVPEWYFLPFYAILRAIPSKLGGVLCMFFAIIVLFFLPFFETEIPTKYNLEYATLF